MGGSAKFWQHFVMECEPTSRSEEPKHQLLKPSEEVAEPFGAGSCDDPCAAVLSSLRDFGMSQLAPHAALALERARVWHTEKVSRCPTVTGRGRPSEA